MSIIYTLLMALIIIISTMAPIMCTLWMAVTTIIFTVGLIIKIAEKYPDIGRMGAGFPPQWFAIDTQALVRGRLELA